MLQTALLSANFRAHAARAMYLRLILLDVAVGAAHLMTTKAKEKPCGLKVAGYCFFEFTGCKHLFTFQERSKTPPRQEGWSVAH